MPELARELDEFVSEALDPPKAGFNATNSGFTTPVTAGVVPPNAGFTKAGFWAAGVPPKAGFAKAGLCCCCGDPKAGFNANAGLSAGLDCDPPYKGVEVEFESDPEAISPGLSCEGLVANGFVVGVVPLKPLSWNPVRGAVASKELSIDQ